MNYSIALSMRLFLAEYIPEMSDVKLLYDGVSLTGVSKPFLSVEYLVSNDSLLSAGRISYEEIYRYQVGLFATDIAERFRLEEKVKTVLRRPDGISIYSESGIATDTRFLCDVSAFTPISNPAGESETNDHHGYFDVAVDILRNTGETEFTQ